MPDRRTLNGFNQRAVGIIAPPEILPDIEKTPVAGDVGRVIIQVGRGLIGRRNEIAVNFILAAGLKIPIKRVVQILPELPGGAVNLLAKTQSFGVADIAVRTAVAHGL